MRGLCLSPCPSAEARLRRCLGEVGAGERRQHAAGDIGDTGRSGQHAGVEERTQWTIQHIWRERLYMLSTQLWLYKLVIIHNIYNNRILYIIQYTVHIIYITRFIVSGVD